MSEHTDVKPTIVLVHGAFADVQLERCHRAAAATGFHRHRSGQPATRRGRRFGPHCQPVREQFTEQQRSHFITVWRLVDEEVIPVIAPYWERAEIPWTLIRRLPGRGIVGEDIRDTYTPG